jgi:hypothetical protein
MELNSPLRRLPNDPLAYVMIIKTEVVSAENTTWLQVREPKITVLSEYRIFVYRIFEKEVYMLIPALSALRTISLHRNNIR